MKAAFDFLAALCGLFLLSPLFLMAALLVKLTSRGPVFFKQERIGKNFKPFQIYKFRSMHLNTGGSLVTAATDSRITPVGKVLRQTKIDELPQLLNVLKGEMSLVGPRPEVRKYVDKSVKAQQIILKVRPGITDWASIAGLDEEKILSQSSNLEKTYIEEILPKKHELQIRYVKSQNFFLDLKIIFLTLAALLNKFRANESRLNHQY